MPTQDELNQLNAKYTGQYNRAAALYSGEELEDFYKRLRTNQLAEEGRAQQAQTELQAQQEKAQFEREHGVFPKSAPILPEPVKKSRLYTRQDALYRQELQRVMAAPENQGLTPDAWEQLAREAADEKSDTLFVQSRQGFQFKPARSQEEDITVPSVYTGVQAEGGGRVAATAAALGEVISPQVRAPRIDESQEYKTDQGRYLGQNIEEATYRILAEDNPHIIWGIEARGVRPKLPPSQSQQGNKRRELTDEQVQEFITDYKRFMRWGGAPDFEGEEEIREEMKKKLERSFRAAQREAEETVFDMSVRVIMPRMRELARKELRKNPDVPFTEENVDALALEYAQDQTEEVFSLHVPDVPARRKKREMLEGQKEEWIDILGARKAWQAATKRDDPELGLVERRPTALMRGGFDTMMNAVTELYTGSVGWERRADGSPVDPNDPNYKLWLLAKEHTGEEPSAEPLKLMGIPTFIPKPWLPRESTQRSETATYRKPLPEVVVSSEAGLIGGAYDRWIMSSLAATEGGRFIGDTWADTPAFQEYLAETGEITGADWLTRPGAADVVGTLLAIPAVWYIPMTPFKMINAMAGFGKLLSGEAAYTATASFRTAARAARQLNDSNIGPTFALPPGWPDKLDEMASSIANSAANNKAVSTAKVVGEYARAAGEVLLSEAPLQTLASKSGKSYQARLLKDIVDDGSKPDMSATRPVAARTASGLLRNVEADDVIDTLRGVKNNAQNELVAEAMTDAILKIEKDKSILKNGARLQNAVTDSIHSMILQAMPNDLVFATDNMDIVMSADTWKKITTEPSLVSTTKNATILTEIYEESRRLAQVEQVLRGNKPVANQWYIALNTEELRKLESIREAPDYLKDKLSQGGRLQTTVTDAEMLGIKNWIKGNLILKEARALGDGVATPLRKSAMKRKGVLAGQDAKEGPPIIGGRGQTPENLRARDESMVDRIKVPLHRRQNIGRSISTLFTSGTEKLNRIAPKAMRGASKAFENILNTKFHKGLDQRMENWTDPRIVEQVDKLQTEIENVPRQFNIMLQQNFRKTNSAYQGCIQTVMQVYDNSENPNATVRNIYRTWLAYFFGVDTAKGLPKEKPKGTPTKRQEMLFKEAKEAESKKSALLTDDDLDLILNRYAEVLGERGEDLNMLSRENMTQLTQWVLSAANDSTGPLVQGGERSLGLALKKRMKDKSELRGLRRTGLTGGLPGVQREDNILTALGIATQHEMVEQIWVKTGKWFQDNLPGSVVKIEEEPTRIPTPSEEIGDLHVHEELLTSLLSTHYERLIRDRYKGEAKTLYTNIVRDLSTNGDVSLNGVYENMLQQLEKDMPESPVVSLKQQLRQLVPEQEFVPEQDVLHPRDIKSTAENYDRNVGDINFRDFRERRPTPEEMKKTLKPEEDYRKNMRVLARKRKSLMDDIGKTGRGKRRNFLSDQLRDLEARMQHAEERWKNSNEYENKVAIQSIEDDWGWYEGRKEEFLKQEAGDIELPSAKRSLGLFDPQGDAPLVSFEGPAGEYIPWLKNLFNERVKKEFLTVPPETSPVEVRVVPSTVGKLRYDENRLRSIASRMDDQIHEEFKAHSRQPTFESDVLAEMSEIGPEVIAEEFRYKRLAHEEQQLEYEIEDLLEAVEPIKKVHQQNKRAYLIAALLDEFGLAQGYAYDMAQGGMGYGDSRWYKVSDNPVTAMAAVEDFAVNELEDLITNVKTGKAVQKDIDNWAWEFSRLYSQVSHWEGEGQVIFSKETVPTYSLQELERILKVWRGQEPPDNIGYTNYIGGWSGDDLGKYLLTANIETVVRSWMESLPDVGRGVLDPKNPGQTLVHSDESISKIYDLLDKEDSIENLDVSVEGLNNKVEQLPYMSKMIDEFMASPPPELRLDQTNSLYPSVVVPEANLKKAIKEKGTPLRPAAWQQREDIEHDNAHLWKNRAVIGHEINSKAIEILDEAGDIDGSLLGGAKGLSRRRRFHDGMANVGHDTDSDLYTFSDTNKTHASVNQMLRDVGDDIDKDSFLEASDDFVLSMVEANPWASNLDSILRKWQRVLSGDQGKLEVISDYIMKTGKMDATIRVAASKRIRERFFDKRQDELLEESYFRDLEEDVIPFAQRRMTEMESALTKKYKGGNVTITPIYDSDPRAELKALRGVVLPDRQGTRVRETLESWDDMVANHPKHARAFNAAMDKLMSDEYRRIPGISREGMEPMPKWGEFPVGYRIQYQRDGRVSKDAIVRARDLSAEFNERFPKTDKKPKSVTLIESHKSPDGKVMYNPVGETTPADKKRIEAYKELAQSQPEDFDPVYYLADPLIQFRDLQNNEERLRKVIKRGLQNAVYRYLGNTPGDILTSMRENGFPTSINNQGVTKAMTPELVDFDDGIYMMADEVLADKINQLRAKGVEEKYGQTLARLQNKSLASEASALWYATRRMQASSLMGISPRYQGVNIISWPFIMMVTNPTFLWRTLKVFGSVAGVKSTLKRSLTAEFGGRSKRRVGLLGKDLTQEDRRHFQKAWDEYYAGGKDTVVLTTPDGTKYTQAMLDEEMNNRNVLFSQVNFEFTDTDIEDMRRIAMLNPDMTDPIEKYLKSLTPKERELNQTWFARMKMAPATRRAGVKAGLTEAGRWVSTVFDPRNKTAFNRIAQSMDETFRRAAFIAALQAGESLEDSARIARTSILDYKRTSKLERKYLARHRLFYSFARNMLVETAEALLRLDKGAENIRNFELANRKLKELMGTYLTQPAYADSSLFAIPLDDEDYTPQMMKAIDLPFLSSLDTSIGFVDSMIYGSANERITSLVDLVVQAPDMQAIFKTWKESDRFKRSDDAPGSYLNPKIIMRWKMLGLWDQAQQLYNIQKTTRPIAGQPTFEGAQYRIVGRKATNWMRFNTWLSLTAGTERLLNEMAVTYFMAKGDPDGIMDVDKIELKRFKGGKLQAILYISGVATPVSGTSLQQQELMLWKAAIDQLSGATKKP
jgi:hypothetical protein